VNYLSNFIIAFGGMIVGNLAYFLWNKKSPTLKEALVNITIVVILAGILAGVVSLIDLYIEVNNK